MSDDINRSDILNAASNIYAALLVSRCKDQNYDKTQDLLELSISSAYQIADKLKEIGDANDADTLEEWLKTMDE